MNDQNADRFDRVFVLSTNSPADDAPVWDRIAVMDEEEAEKQLGTGEQLEPGVWCYRIDEYDRPFGPYGDESGAIAAMIVRLGREMLSSWGECGKVHVSRGPDCPL